MVANIGIGAKTPSKKLDIRQGFKWFDEILIRIILKYFNKRNIIVTFSHKVKVNGIKINPNEKLIIYTNGNVGIGV